MTPQPTGLYASAARAGYTASGYDGLYEPDEIALLVADRADHPQHRAVVDHVWNAAHAWFADQIDRSAVAVGSMHGAADLDQRRADLCAQYGELIAQRPGMATEPGA